jgi:hypothetical protein
MLTHSLSKGYVELLMDKNAPSLLTRDTITALSEKYNKSKLHLICLPTYQKVLDALRIY